MQDVVVVVFVCQVAIVVAAAGVVGDGFVSLVLLVWTTTNTWAWQTTNEHGFAVDDTAE